MQLTSGQITLQHRWWYQAMHLEHEEGEVLLQVYGVRVVALAAATGLWVLQVLLSGAFSVAMVILVGAAVGNAHRLLGCLPRRAHHSSALLLTVGGGLCANVLAGLALFSSTMGVDYHQVLAASRIPDDLPMLAGVFAESYQPVDTLYYLLAAAVAMLSARRLRPRRKPESTGRG